MRVDLGAPFAREQPRPRRKGKLEPLHRHNGDPAHAQIPGVSQMRSGTALATGVNGIMPRSFPR